MSEDTDRAEGKPPHLDRLSVLWRRLNEHKIVQWSVAYVALAYGIQHGVILTSESLEWPAMVARATMLLLALGLPLVVTFAWYHGARASRNFTQAELSIVAVLLVLSSLLFYVFVRPAGEAAPGAQQASVVAARTTAASPTGAISIAVLPFANLSGDAGQEFFSDGVTEEITSALAKVPNLQVVGRISTFQFKGQNKDLATIKKVLNARYLIDGSVRKVGERVRITAQLIQAENGLNVWTDNYDRQLTDIFAIQEEIAQAIATSLRVPLGLQQGETVVRSRTNTSASYDDYLRAKTLVRTRGFALVNQAIGLLEQVVARDPGYAPAWALLAEAYANVPNQHPAWTGGNVEEARSVVNASLSRAEMAAQRSIQIDSNLASGYGALGYVQEPRGNLLTAEDLYLKALAIDPNNPDFLNYYSQLLAKVGRLKEALATRQHLQVLEPFVPIFYNNNAGILWLNGQTEAALEILRAGAPGVRSFDLARIYAALGRYNEAAEALMEMPAGVDAPGTREEAVRLLRTAAASGPSSVKTGPLKLNRFGFVYVYLGDPVRVLEFYEDNVESGYSSNAAPSRLWHSSYAPVRKTERFKALVRKMGLTDYWKARGWPPLCHPVGADDFACE